MKSKILLGVMVLMALAMVKADDPLIGYEYVENFLHTHNQNPLGEDKSNIWFNISSGTLQFMNGKDIEEARERSTWLTHAFGLGYYSPNGRFEYLSKDTLNNAENEVTSDYETYWEQLLYKCLNLTQGQNNREFCAGFQRYQETFDELMQNNFVFYVNSSSQPPFTLLRNMSYVWEFNNIQIENDHDDFIRYCWVSPEGDKCSILDLDTNNNEFLQRNLSRFEILDWRTKDGHYVSLTDNSNISLRYNTSNNVLLEADLGMLVNFTGAKKTKLSWIDAPPQCISGFINESFVDGLGTTRICVDSTNEMTGWLFGVSSASQDSNNSNPLMGGERAGIAHNRYRSFYGFNTNLSEIPYNQIQDYSDFVFWNGLSASQLTPMGPTDWISDFYVLGNGFIEDNGGVDRADWNNGMFGWTINWDPDYCGSNRPCEVGILETNTTTTEQQFSLAGNNSRWFHIINRDASTAGFGNVYIYSGDALGDPIDTTRIVYLNVSFKMPNGTLNVNYTFPSTPNNNTLFNDSSIILNVSGIAGGDYHVQDTYVNVNGTVHTNVTDVFNGSVGIANINVTGEGAYWVELNVTDQFGFRAKAGRVYFNLSVEEPISETEILKKEDNVFPFVLVLIVFFMITSQFRRDHD